MKRTTIASFMCLVFSALVVSPAVASCVEPDPLETSIGRARVVFVGTVVATSNMERNADVSVEKIWFGERLPERVEVLSGPQEANVASSADRQWTEGRRYLFVLEDATPPFRDDACSATTEYDDEVAALEPEGTIAPLSPEDGGTIDAWVLLGLALLALGLLQARRAGRRAHDMEI